MGKKRAAIGGGSRTQAIEDAIAQNPTGTPLQIAAELRGRGIDVTTAFVSVVMTVASMRKKRSAKTRPEPEKSAPTLTNSEEGSGGSKSQAIKAALAKNPHATATALAAELKAQGVLVTPTYVSLIKSSLKEN